MESAAIQPSYDANCHCGIVRVSFYLDETLESKEIIICNCSICTKNGYLNVFTPKTRFKFVRGENDLKSYQYGIHSRDHFFCTNCGTSIINIPHDESPDAGSIGINIRAINGIQLDNLKYRKVDGWTREPLYVIPE